MLELTTGATLRWRVPFTARALYKVAVVHPPRPGGQRRPQMAPRGEIWIEISTASNGTLRARCDLLVTMATIAHVYLPETCMYTPPYMYRGPIRSPRTGVLLLL